MYILPLFCSVVCGSFICVRSHVITDGEGGLFSIFQTNKDKKNKTKSRRLIVDWSSCLVLGSPKSSLLCMRGSKGTCFAGEKQENFHRFL